MKATDFSSAIIAHELTRRHPPGEVEKLAGALVDAQVDINPHQVEAALFAFKSPLSHGALLADEVGLGKTIEAGLVLSQKWAERRRRVLVIVPANLRKQWYQELSEKFFLPCRILESKTYKDFKKSGVENPFDAEEVIICSYQFARSKSAELQGIGWDLVVIDEAHRLRNVYKTSNVIANALKKALAGTPKILLTATPLQNTLLELYGLVSFIDEHAFGDMKSFREQFSDLTEDAAFLMLKNRLKPLCHRTLRRQVLEYVAFTRRRPMTEEFTPETNEDLLYQQVSDYLRREDLLALPKSQRSLMTLVLRKLLASSTFAIAGALDTLANRLKEKVGDKSSKKSLEEEFDEEYESLESTAEEWDDDKEDEVPLTEKDKEAIRKEIAELDALRESAVNITQNAKGATLLKALDKAFQEAERLGAARKCIIFTESRRTQDYLVRLLEGSEHSDGIVLFNGSNNDARSKKIYADWSKRHAGTDRLTGSKTADMRSALVDTFREEGKIMIATEAGAEGINLQFCSLIVNYDLPWNPQRIEQRIGRCHRYGQKHDVVVVNFLNKNNEADRRVYELLEEKFRLFEGVFGASDEVLGAIESGVDVEKRIAGIYQTCRTNDEIISSFKNLQSELSQKIDETLSDTRRKLLENFDQEVHDKLRLSQTKSQELRDGREKLLMRLTRAELADHAKFDGEEAFTLKENPFPDLDIATGRYELPRRSGEAHIYRMAHPLAIRLLHRAKIRKLPDAELIFDWGNSYPRVAALQDYRGQRGELLVSQLSVDALSLGEDRLLYVATTDEGEILPDEIAEKFFLITKIRAKELPPTVPSELIRMEMERRTGTAEVDIAERAAHYLDEETEKLESWAEDLKTGLEREIKEIDRKLKEARRTAQAMKGLKDKLDAQKIVKALDAERGQKRKRLFETQDEIDRRRDELITEVQAKLDQKSESKTVLFVRWRIEN